MRIKLINAKKSAFCINFVILCIVLKPYQTIGNAFVLQQDNAAEWSDADNHLHQLR